MRECARSEVVIQIFLLDSQGIVNLSIIGRTLPNGRNPMTSQEQEPQGYVKFNELTETLQDLDERALVLTLAAFAEDSLGELLSAFMIPSSASKDLLTGFNAPLGTFSSRIKACYAFGLISKGQFDDLQHLRVIRNKFSHTWRPISFADPAVAGHIKSIRFSRLQTQYPASLTQKVKSSFVFLLMELQVGVTQMAKGRSAKFVGMELSAGVAGTTFAEKLERASSDVSEELRKHTEATGEEKLFFDGVLRFRKDKLTLLWSQAPPAESWKVLAMIHKVESHLKDRPPE